MDPRQKKIFMMIGLFAFFFGSMIIFSYFNAMRKAGLQKSDLNYCN